MAKDKGILLDENGDLLVQVKRNSAGQITQGLVVGDVTEQNIAVILKVQPGEIKEFPLVGVGIDNMLLSHDALLFEHKIREQLITDGYMINSLKIEKDNIYIDAKYK
jgi:hypothetical protein